MRGTSYSFYVVHLMFMGESPTYVISLEEKNSNGFTLVIRYLKTDFFQTQYDDRDR